MESEFNGKPASYFTGHAFYNAAHAGGFREAAREVIVSQLTYGHARLKATASKAVTAHAAAVARLEAVSARRARIVAVHDALVAAALAEVGAAIAEVARLLGADVAAAVLNLPRSELRRKVRSPQVQKLRKQPGGDRP